MLFFTKKGKCYWLIVFDLAEGSKISKGRAIQNVLNIEPDDKACAFINVHNLSDKEYVNNNYIVLCTKRGIVKKTSLEAYSRPRANGVNAITIKENDELLEATLTNGKNEILLASREGKCVRFNESCVRAIGRTGAGVKGINISEDNEVIGMICVDTDTKGSGETKHVLVVSENGYGKRSLLDDYRVVNRGGKGVKTLSITEKTGKLIAIKDVSDDNDLMIITKSGLTIRLEVSSIRVSGRATQGVKLINIKEGDSIAAVCRVNKSEEKPVETEELE
jgi:DNA gyrase subunit A